MQLGRVSPRTAPACPAAGRRRPAWRLVPALRRFWRRPRCAGLPRRRLRGARPGCLGRGRRRPRSSRARTGRGIRRRGSPSRGLRHRGPMSMRTLLPAAIGPRTSVLREPRMRRSPRPTAATNRRRAVANLSLAVKESGGTVSRGRLPAVRADGSQLEHVFQNLIGNAIKFRGDEPPPRKVRKAKYKQPKIVRQFLRSMKGVMAGMPF